MSTVRQEGLTVEDIAQRTGGTVHGDKSVRVFGIKPLVEATKRDLSFFAPSSKRNAAILLTSSKTAQAAAILVREKITDIQTTQIVVPDPVAAVSSLAEIFYPKPLPDVGVHAQAHVDPSAKLGKDVRIGPFVSVGRDAIIGDRVSLFSHVVVYPEAQIGDDCVIHSGSVIREGVILGKDCLIQNGVVVGGEGFGYNSSDGKSHRRIPQVGITVLEDQVDLGANTTIDRATLGVTRIGAGTKIDNLVMVGHNCDVGKLSILCSQVGISGSTKIGNGVVLGGKVGVADHIEIGDRARAAAGSGITGSVEAGTDVAGYPARKAMQWKREFAALSRLPEVLKQLRREKK